MPTLASWFFGKLTVESLSAVEAGSHTIFPYDCLA